MVRNAEGGRLVSSSDVRPRILSFGKKKRERGRTLTGIPFLLLLKLPLHLVQVRFEVAEILLVFRPLLLGQDVVSQRQVERPLDAEGPGVVLVLRQTTHRLLDGRGHAQRVVTTKP